MSSQAASPAAPQLPTTDGLPAIAINVQYIKDFSFESPNAPQVFAPTQSQIALNLGVNVATKPVGEMAFEVLLSLKLEGTLESKPAFIVELAYGGVFTVQPMEEEALKFMLMAEAPRYLFPYARAILANALRDGGFPQILVTPIDFVALYQANKSSLGHPVGNA